MRFFLLYFLPAWLLAILSAKFPVKESSPDPTYPCRWCGSSK